MSPRLQCHHATVEILPSYSFARHPALPVFPFSVPPDLLHIVQRHNSTLDPAALSTDKLNPLAMWKVYFWSQWGCLRVIHPPPAPLHCALYFQTTHHNLSDTRACGWKKRYKSSCDQQIGQDYSNIATNTTMIQQSFTANEMTVVVLVSGKPY